MVRRRMRASGGGSRMVGFVLRRQEDGRRKERGREGGCVFSRGCERLLLPPAASRRHGADGHGVEQRLSLGMISQSSLHHIIWKWIVIQCFLALQRVYSFDEKTHSIQVDTFCVHGGPDGDGYITGIRGRVHCVSEEDMASAETDLERQEMIRRKCYLQFPTLPFIPKEPYDGLAL